MIRIILLILNIVIISALFIIKKIYKGEKNVVNVIVFLIIAIIIEIDIFNINSFRTFFKDYESKCYTVNQMNIQGVVNNKDESFYTFKDKTVEIELSSIDTEVATIELDIDLINSNELNYSIEYTDKTSKNYRNLIEKTLANKVKRSKYTPCYLSGKSEKIKIILNALEGTQIKINSINLNKQIPFQFNVVRVLIIFFIVLLIYSLLNFKSFNRPFSEKDIKQNNILLSLILVFIAIVTWINFTTPLSDRIYNEYVSSIMNGKITLNAKPSEELEQLENPYDITQRQEIKYKWDAAYYNGSYYIYFGILPALILFIPLKVLFGYTIPIFIGVLVFSIGIIINLVKSIKLIYKMWFNKLNFSYLILAVIGIISGSLIFWINRRPETYELVLSAGVFFITLGFYSMFKAIENREQISYKYLCIAAISFSLAVACRPNLLLISLCFIPIIIEVLKKSSNSKKNIVKTLCVIGIPYLIVGISLMIFNYIRFDSPFEFGANYQLTVNDMKNLKFRWLTIPVGLYTQLLKLPVTKNIYPFFEYEYSTIAFGGYYYLESFVCGLLVLNPINIILLFLIKLKNKIQDKEAYRYACIFVVVSTIVCIVNIVLAGSMQRYSMDYAWLLNIASYITLFIIVNNIKSDEIKKYIFIIGMVITIYMLLINLFIGGIISEKNLLEIINPTLYFKIMYNICFWI